jgi:hypothetical protein
MSVGGPQFEPLEHLGGSRRPAAAEDAEQLLPAVADEERCLRRSVCPSFRLFPETCRVIAGRSGGAARERAAKPRAEPGEEPWGCLPGSPGSPPARSAVRPPEP